MKRILIVVWSNLNNSGGVQNGIKHMTSVLKDEFVFDIVTFFRVDPDNLGAYSIFDKIHCIPCNRSNKIAKLFEYLFRPLRLYRGAMRILGEVEYDVVHCHDLQLGAYFMRAAKQCNVPIRICHSHNPDAVKKNDLFRKVYCTLLRPIVNKNSNVKIGCSKKACDYMFGEKTDGTFVVNNELILADFDLNKYPRNDTGTVRFVHVGRFTYQKNHDFLLDTFNYIHKRIKESSLTLVGWGELETPLKEKISQYGIEEVVTFLPHTSNIPEVFSNADYMIFPSRFEGLGRVLIEAQAMGVMCFASDVVPDETALGCCKYFSLSDGYEKWGNRIIEFIQTGEREKYSINRELLSTFDINHVADKYAAIYRGEYN